VSVRTGIEPLAGTMLPHPELPSNLGAGVAVILTPPCTFHQRFPIQHNIQGGVRMTLTSARPVEPQHGEECLLVGEEHLGEIQRSQ
jgi:hypothetical protein